MESGGVLGMVKHLKGVVSVMSEEGLNDKDQSSELLAHGSPVALRPAGNL